MPYTPNTEELHARIALHSLPLLGPRRFRRLLDVFDCAADALAATDQEWRRAGIPTTCVTSRESHLQVQEEAWHSAETWLQEPDHHLLMWDTPEYPALLGELDDAPPLLFVRGNPAILEHPQIAIVGSRNASRPGLDTAQQFAMQLATAGFVITSGMALGIDSAAHRGALTASGRTIAVQGTGLFHLYPKSHRELGEQIVDGGGVLVSEFPLNTAPQASNFPRRNRIITGLSLGLLVVEAGLASGSLISARLAAQQGREVFAIPGSIHHPGARGCHQLIREGATLVENIDHMLQELQGWKMTIPQEQPTDPTSRPTPHPLFDLLRAEPQTSEALAARSGMELPQVLAALTELEIGGHVCCEAGIWQAR